MWTDIWSVIWRDLRLYRSQFDEPRRFVLGIAASFVFLVGIEIAFDIHRQLMRAHPLLLIWIWCWLPLGSAVTLATDAVAGERERHTLETLLATRLPTRAILIGKAVAITLQSWLSTLMLAMGALVALNLITLWSGIFFVFPLSVLLAGPLASLAVALLGTLAALLISTDAPTVRQANFRILLVSSILPVLLIAPLIIFLAFGAVMLVILVEVGVAIPSRTIVNAPWFIGASIALAVFGLLIAIASVYLAADLRFTRERMLSTSPRTPPGVPAQSSQVSVDGVGRDRAANRSPLAQSDSRELRVSHNEPAWLAILRDARVMAWKEFVEAKGLLHEWRGWLFIVGFALTWMVVQMSAIGSWYWTQDADLSIVFWLAMAAAIPLFIAQRSADAIAGERERHTGEILFTTRLSHTGIVLGKLTVVALLPWTVALAIPIVGLVVTNLIHSGGGPFWYPPDVLAAGIGLTLSVAFLFAAGGLLVSLTSPTVQHAARRISWFLMPILIAPGLVLRRASLGSPTNQDGEIDASGALAFLASGDFALYALLAFPLVVAISTALTIALINRFQRGVTVFD